MYWFLVLATEAFGLYWICTDAADITVLELIICMQRKQMKCSHPNLLDAGCRMAFVGLCVIFSLAPHFLHVGPAVQEDEHATCMELCTKISRIVLRIGVQIFANLRMILQCMLNECCNVPSLKKKMFQHEISKRCYTVC